MANITYLRVSTDDQTTANQRLEIETKSGVIIDKEFADEAVSGATGAKERPQFKAMLEYIREGDHLYVSAIDRLGRNTIDVLATVETLKAKGVKVHSLREDFDLTTPQGQMMLTMLAALAQMEKAIIAERRDAGMARARAEGKHMGRPRKVSLEVILSTLQANEGNVSKTAKALGVARATVIRTRDIAAGKKVAK
ncbi:recombinase family protein [Craterilacuibacter sp. RT1T]|uniref:recombinase family protein n=1 Tax=Craterilacuibacter sp. RT1T TaxID=2942211 RepID=UPI0020C01F23|nr:recombinase family protein [Craterilacuibacter sp. RT1T]MCL6264386.1 recombinase family protein [Craterilacuibacter sp. RT1T]